jgi:hypothetical protein
MGRRLRRGGHLLAAGLYVRSCEREQLGGYVRGSTVFFGQCCLVGHGRLLRRILWVLRMTWLQSIGGFMSGRGDDDSWKLEWKEWNVFIGD